VDLRPRERERERGRVAKGRGGESKKGMHVGIGPVSRSVNNFRKLNYTGFSPLLIFARDFSVA